MAKPSGTARSRRFDAWMTRILVRSCQDTRRRARRRAVELPLLANDDPDIADHQATFAVTDQLERGLQGLTVDQRTVIVLSFYLDLPIAEAASVTRCPSRDHEVPPPSGDRGPPRHCRCGRPTDRSDRGANDMTADRDLELYLRAHFDATADRDRRGRSGRAILAAIRRPPAATGLAGLPEESSDVHHSPLTGASDLGARMGAATHPRFAHRDRSRRSHRRWLAACPAPVLNGPIVFGRFDPAVSDTVIHSIRPDGSALRVVLAGPNECPQFSPDGRQLAVAMIAGSGREPSPQVVDVDGTNVRSLPNRAGRRDARLLDVVAGRHPAGRRRVRRQRPIGQRDLPRQLLRWQRRRPTHGQWTG